MRFSQTVFCLALAGTVVPAALATGVTYTITADTSSISGKSGYLDLQLEPGPSMTNLVMAGVGQFATTGTLSGTATLTGDATGQLPSALSFDNQAVFNDYFQAMQFGATLSFKVTLNGPTPLGGSASAFNIGFYGADGSTPLLSSSPDGIAGQILINPDGSTMAVDYAGQALSVSSAPESSSWMLIMSGLVAAFLFALAARRKRIEGGSFADPRG